MALLQRHGELLAGHLKMLARASVTSIDLVFTRYGAGQHGSVQRISLLPLDSSVIKMAETPIPPLVNVGPRQLFNELAAEYVFALLDEAVMESFGSVNGARFSMLGAARDKIQNI